MFDVNAETGEIFLYDDIGPEWYGMIDAGAVMRALAEIPAGNRVTLRINSPGGSVDEAIAIYGALERRGGIDVAIDSVAASAASYIAMVGETITIAEGGAVMIHDPWTLAIGNSAELRKTADLLDTYRDRIIGAYERRLKVDREAVQALLTAETWYTSESAVEAGIADAVGNYKPADPAAIAAGRYKNTPANLLKQAVAGSRTQYPINRKQAEVRARKIAASLRNKSA